MRLAVTAVALLCMLACAGCQRPPFLGGPVFLQETETKGAPALPEGEAPVDQGGAGVVADFFTELSNGPDSLTIRKVTPVADPGLIATWEGWCPRVYCQSGALSWDASHTFFLASYSRAVPFTIHKGKRIQLAFRVRADSGETLRRLQTSCLYMRAFDLELDDGTVYRVVHAPTPFNDVPALIEIYGDVHSKSGQNCPDIHGNYPHDHGPYWTPAPSPG